MYCLKPVICTLTSFPIATCFCLVSPWLFSQLFPPNSFHVMSQSLFCPGFLFHASMHITFPCFSWLWALFTTLFAVGGYATSTSSGVSGMMLAHHLLIYFFRSWHIPSFSTFPLWRAAGLLLSLPSSENKTLTCEGSDLPALHLQPHLHLLKSSAISLFLFPNTKADKLSTNTHFIGDTRCLLLWQTFFQGFVKDTNKYQSIIWGA